MFRNTRGGGRDILPTSGNGRSGGGGSMYGAARGSKPAMSNSFIATMFWAVLSLGLIAGGWTYCSRRLESTSIKCDMKGCKLVELTNGEAKVLTIPRSEMIRGELVRVRNGEMVDPSQMRRSAQRKLGHTYAVVYTEPDSEDDDDESYDSFEDDDDSYDSYEDDQDSSEDEDDDEDDDGPRGAKGGGKNAPPANKKPTTTSGKSSKFVPKKLSEAEKKVAAEKKEALRMAAIEKKKAERERYAQDRRNRGKEPVREPDEQKGRRPERRQAAQRPMDDDEERFPGDAGTMEEKNRDQIAQMEAAQGMAARDHRAKSQQAYEDASRRHIDKNKIDMQTKQMGNNLHDRKKAASPDDPDNKPPPPPKVEENNDDRPGLERGEAQKDLSGANGVEEGAAAVDTAAAADTAAAVDTAEDPEAKIKELQARLAQFEAAAEAETETKNAGGRTISSVGGLESVDEDQLSGEDEARREGLPGDGEAGEEAGALERGREYDTLGDFVHAGAAGARRKLLTWKNRVKNVDRPAARRTREEIDRDAAKDRDSHRRGHGHHQKRAKKVAATVPNEVGAKVPQAKEKHHHKAFHHKEEVPAEDRHHVHPGFHHQDGEKKIEHGWKHQHRQWHGKREMKKLGTSYNLGRSKSRKRKEAIDAYVSRRSHKVDFVDSKKWRAVGLWMMIVGFISVSFCLIVGNFQPRPKTKKVS